MLYRYGKIKAHIVGRSIIRPWSTRFTLRHDRHREAALGSIVTSISGSERMVAYCPGIRDGQVCTDIAIGITLYRRVARDRRAIKQEGDGRVGRELLATDVEGRAG